MGHSDDEGYRDAIDSLAAFATIVAFLADVLVAPALVYLTARPSESTGRATTASS